MLIFIKRIQYEVFGAIGYLSELIYIKNINNYSTTFLTPKFIKICSWSYEKRETMD